MWEASFKKKKKSFLKFIECKKKKFRHFKFMKKHFIVILKVNKNPMPKFLLTITQLFF